MAAEHLSHGTRNLNGNALQGLVNPRLGCLGSGAQQLATALSRHRKGFKSSALPKIHFKIPFLANLPALFCMRGAAGNHKDKRIPRGASSSPVMDGILKSKGLY
jgi:hypothetical protein